MSAQVNLQSASPNIDSPPAEDVSYSLYFGLGQCLTLVDHPEVFKVSAAGKAFGSLLSRRFGRQYGRCSFSRYRNGQWRAFAALAPPGYEVSHGHGHFTPGD